MGEVVVWATVASLVVVWLWFMIWLCCGGGTVGCMVSVSVVMEI